MKLSEVELVKYETWKQLEMRGRTNMATKIFHNNLQAHIYYKHDGKDYAGYVDKQDNIVETFEL